MRELEAAVVVELLHGADQADVALLHQVEQRHAAPDVLLGHAHHQAQVGLDEVFLRFFRLGVHDFQVVGEFFLVRLYGLDELVIVGQLFHSVEDLLGVYLVDHLARQQAGVERQVDEYLLDVRHGAAQRLRQRHGQVLVDFIIDSLAYLRREDGLLETGGVLEPELFLQRVHKRRRLADLLEHGLHYLGGGGVASQLFAQELAYLIDALALLHLLCQALFIIGGQQRHAAYLVQVHAHRVVHHAGLFELLDGDGKVRAEAPPPLQGLLWWGALPRLSLP